MSSLLPPLRLTGARVLRDGALRDDAITVADGHIRGSGGVSVDLSGYLLLPGIIDLHGDGFEGHLSPRPATPFPMAAGLASFDREAAAQGVTTAYLAQGWSWEGGHRGPDHAEALMMALAAFRPQALCDLRLQLRVETHLVGQSDRLLAAVQQHGIDYAVFNDHLEEGFRASRLHPTSFAAWARKVGLSTTDLMARMEAARAQAKAVPRNLCKLAEGFDGLGVRYGSHDDPDAETRQLFAMIGAHIAEFPTTRRAAAAAASMGDPVIMGAPNVVRGGSQSGNVSAAQLVAEGLCDVLVSDYHLPALPLAAWALVDQGICDLAQAWAMISTKPAQVLGLKDRGQIDAGLRADLVVMNAETRQIEATMAAGRLAWLSGAAALRFLNLAQPNLAQPMRLAAE